ncbi:hypothetical protein ACICHK_00030 [Streptomyces sp. AHU1]|uniref:hypothetical protein n=1 Tax=Streptomyces sp. AHU1 TaxID=3377215 RepID=UPI003878302A
MPTDSTHTFRWTHLPFEEEDEPQSLLLTVARQVVELLDGQWGAAEGPGGRTGHLRDAQQGVFTIGVCEAGCVFLRNDGSGAVMHLPHVDADSSADEISEVVHEHLHELF